jgi:phosphate transport system protein
MPSLLLQVVAITLRPVKNGVGNGLVAAECRSGERRCASGVTMTTVPSMRVSFHEELVRIEALLRREGEFVGRSIRGCVKALQEEDLELADEVIAFDDEIDRIWLEIEGGIEVLLARQTPVASDLRLVLAMIHVNLHLERMADYCVTVAKLVKLSAGLGSDETLIDGFREMGLRAEEMLIVAMDSFSSRDLEGAQRLVELDELIDRANRRVVSHVFELGGDPALREWGLRMIIVSRALERVGDHAVDIGEQTAYLVTGEFREFTDASHPEIQQQF